MNAELLKECETLNISTEKFVYVEHFEVNLADLDVIKLHSAFLNAQAKYPNKNILVEISTYTDKNYDDTYEAEFYFKEPIEEQELLRKLEEKKGKIEEAKLYERMQKLKVFNSLKKELEL